MTLEALRSDVVTALTAAGLTAVEYVAEAMQPPVAVVVPDQPYIDTEDVRFGHVNVHMTVLLVGSKGTNSAAASEIDSMIETAYAALADDWEITEVTQPSAVELSGGVWLGAVLSISTETRL